MKKRYVDIYIEDLITLAKKATAKALENYKVAIVGWSSGKDSSLTLDLTIKTLVKMKQEGKETPLLIVHTNDTTVELPEVIKHARKESKKIKSFLDDTGLEYIISVGKPSLTNTWAVQLLTGRKLPTYRDKKTADCSVDYKVNTGTRSIKTALKSKNLKLSDALFILGTRFEESTVRKANMNEREESSTTVAKNSKSGDSFAPIAEWYTLDVWTYLSLGSEDAVFSDNTSFNSYSDFTELNRLYSDASDTEGCQVFASSESDKRGCGGSRFGCWTCVKSGPDKSMLSLIKNDTKYNYLKPLSKIQQFIYKSQYNWEMRNPVSRTLSNDGILGIQPDTLHPKTIEKLYIACLTIDRDYEEEMYRDGLDAPRVDATLNAQRIAYIDALWSLRGMFPPFHAWKLAEEVYSYNRSEYFEDEIVEYSKTPIPKKRFLNIAEHFKPFSKEDQKHFWGRKFSVRDFTTYLEDETTSDLIPNINDSTEFNQLIKNDQKLTLNNWEVVLDTKIAKAISMDMSHIETFLEEVAGYTIKGNSLCTLEKVKNFTPHHGYSSKWGRCSGFKSYLTFGVMKYSKGQKKWIENAVSLTFARQKALGQWDIPTYNELTAITLETRPNTGITIPEFDLISSDGSLFLFDATEMNELEGHHEEIKPLNKMKIYKTKAKPIYGDAKNQMALAI
jgi:3'-phosphoadenosine 5'-phosphosulfate sulfotransferase (PAPS reductase)/FAD synthetase